MPETKNIFIAHVHADDALVGNLKGIIEGAGMRVRDSSITSDRPNNANNPDYIKSAYLRPSIDWASTVLVIISHDTAQSDWVNWEIGYAAQQGKTIVGVFAQGAKDADIPDELRRIGDAVVVGWNGRRVVDAINGKIRTFDNPTQESSEPTPAKPLWSVRRHNC